MRGERDIVDVAPQSAAVSPEGLGRCTVSEMSTYEGFTFKSRKAGATVAIFHHGRLAMTLKGDDATTFLDEVGKPPSQDVMARAAGMDTDRDTPGPSLRVSRDQQHRGPIGR